MMEGPILTELIEQLADPTELLFPLIGDEVGNNDGVDNLPAKRIEGRRAPAYRLCVRRTGWNGQRSQKCNREKFASHRFLSASNGPLKRRYEPDVAPAILHCNLKLHISTMD